MLLGLVALDADDTNDNHNDNDDDNNDDDGDDDRNIDANRAKKFQFTFGTKIIQRIAVKATKDVYHVFHRTPFMVQHHLI